MKNNKGITLISLVVTIIVLLILAGVSIAMLSGDNSILSRAKETGYKQPLANAQEVIGVNVADEITKYMNKVYIDSNASDGQTTEAGAIYTAITNAKSSLNADTATSATEYSQVTKLKVHYDGTATTKGTKVTVSYNKYYIVGTISGNGILSWGEITKSE